MREEQFQPLVAPALCALFQLRPEQLHREVATREGSIADIVAFHQNQVLVFELKLAEPGEVLAALGARGLRQLRHYRQVADAVYVVTVAAPRVFDTVGGRVVVREPLEAQLVPDGVGWVIFDVITHAATIARPAGEGSPRVADRAFLCDQVLNRLGRVSRTVQGCRQCVA